MLNKMSPHVPSSTVRIYLFYLYLLLLNAGSLTGNPANVPDASPIDQYFNRFSDPVTRTERSFRMSKVEPPSRPNSNWDDPYHRPYFDNSTSRNVTAPLGKAAYLHCRIHQLGDRTVSWVRQRDLHILTVGSYTYTSDQRFKSLHLDGTTDWTLKIQYTQKHDAGVYECQVSTEPKMNLSIKLNVVVAKATIPGGPNMYIQSGGTFNLTCIITDNTSPPTYVFWYHDGRMINYDSTRGVSVITNKESKSVSTLQIENASSSHSGNYSCTPSYADPANITVHVLNGENPAAMHHGGKANQSERCFHVNVQFLLLVLLQLTVFLIAR
ncbi:uncharacterized protein LOC143249704 [Tachypleus tridentatus]|uniref:uncharacterized protein LOC143249704 n=1 Tax=Tachypleus tridentatus TaxID=6853 RepID=UPI003FD021A9